MRELRLDDGVRIKIQHSVLMALEELMAIRQRELKELEVACDKKIEESRDQQEPWTYKSELVYRFKSQSIEPLLILIRDANLIFDSVKYNKVSQFWHRRMSWFPIQFCMICGSWYFGGLPSKGWLPGYQEYCSRRCAALDLDTL